MLISFQFAFLRVLGLDEAVVLSLGSFARLKPLLHVPDEMVPFLWTEIE